MEGRWRHPDRIIRGPWSTCTCIANADVGLILRPSYANGLLAILRPSCVDVPIHIPIDRTVCVAIWSNLIHGSTISRITDHERRGKICCSVMTCITQAFLHTRCPCLMFYLNAVFGWKKLNCWLHIIWRKYRQHIVLFKFLLITMRVFRTSWRVTFETPPGPAPWTASGRLPFPGAYVMTLQ